MQNGLTDDREACHISSDIPSLGGSEVLCALPACGVQRFWVHIMFKWVGHLETPGIFGLPKGMMGSGIQG